MCIRYFMPDAAMAGYTADDFQMQDDTGTFGFTCEDSMGDFGPQRTYRFDRDVTGRLVIIYRQKLWKRILIKLTLDSRCFGHTAAIRHLDLRFWCCR